MLAAGNADLCPLPRFVSFAPHDADPHAFRINRHILDGQSNQFGAPQGAGEPDQDEGAIPSAPGGEIAGLQQFS